MSEVEFRERILAIEAHYDQRVRSSNWRERMYLPYALDCMAFLSEVVEADYYKRDFPEIVRPSPKNAWESRELARWEAAWSKA